MSDVGLRAWDKVGETVGAPVVGDWLGLDTCLFEDDEPLRGAAARLEVYPEIGVQGTGGFDHRFNGEVVGAAQEFGDESGADLETPG